MNNRRIITCLFTLPLVAMIASPVQAQRTVQSLSGPWLFQQAEDANTWKPVTLPTSFEEHEGIEFDGIGIYNRQIPAFNLPAGSRAILHFQAVATLAEVTFNGTRVATHLGGWTPFRIDVTELVNKAPNGAAHELTVRVDEKVGHNSQGFLPVFAPHFGGIWQDVQLLIVPDRWIDDLRLFVQGDPKTGNLNVRVPLLGSGDRTDADDGNDLQLAIRHRLVGQADWSSTTVAPIRSSKRVGDAADDGGTSSVLEIPVPDWQYWSPSTPNLYELDVQLMSGVGETFTASDRVTARGAFRTLKVDGHKLVLNGKPLAVRGLLNWGYAPPRVAPSIDVAHFRAEIELAQSYGFNLMKFCLWVPPKRYLELADEMGILTWMEYPTWHSQWTPDQLPTLEREFSEFFCYDRNHPSIALRSLTCETGPSADLGVIQALYDRCHTMIPGSIVEDDSSWISWNRVHDFYDDHPYGNNHTWVATLDRLKQHISQRTAKPLVLGEAIAADTWSHSAQLKERVGDRRPFWLPRFHDGNEEWLAAMRETPGSGGLEQLSSDSKHYALLMRKYQIETYRREVPFGGYVVSVIRDMPLCSMGLIDYLDQPKWAADRWDWHGDTMLLLATESDRRSFFGGEPLNAQLAVSHFGDSEIRDGSLIVTLHTQKPTSHKIVARKTITLPGSGLHQLEPLDIQLPQVSRPAQFLLRAELSSAGRRWTNQWPLWLVPRPATSSNLSITPHSSCSDEVKDLFRTNPTVAGKADAMHVVVATHLDAELIDSIEQGGRVLLLPDGEKGSLPLSNEWFLRGGPYIAEHALTQQVPRQMIVELQHFDLAGPVIPDIQYLDQITPIWMLWHNHDLDRVKTQGLVFETRIGKGRLLASALRHTGATNAAGQWLIDALVEHLATGPAATRTMTPASVAFMKAKINEQRIELVNLPWQFRPDGDNQGLQENWHLPSHTLSASWKPIRIGQAWEGLGYPTLDGWAWYRLEVDVPDSWKGNRCYVSFHGVDDYYELFVNGTKAGSGGDIESRTTAFEERVSHDVTEHVQAGQKVVIAIRVYDWYGAGGVFRPVVLSTAPLSEGAAILR